MVFCRIAKNKREIIFWRKVLKHEEAIAIGWNTTAWYSQYHGVVLPVPRLGTRRTKPRRKSGTARGGRNPRALQ